MKDRLIELLSKMQDEGRLYDTDKAFAYKVDNSQIATFLLRNGVVVPPCKIGDTVWGIRNYGGTKKIVSGEVTEMFFTDNMKIAVVLKHVARGYLGKHVFSSYEEAERALKGRDEDV